MIKRKKTKVVRVADLLIGGNNPIVVQSMTKTSTKNVKATVKQIKELEKAGCQLVRLAVKDMIDAKMIRQIKKQVNLPLVADIHFDYKLALVAIEAGIDKLRINPGNLNNKEEVKQLVVACKENNVPIRIGVNSGSLEKEIIKKYKGVTAKGMVESALKQVKLLEKFDFNNIVISLKATSVPMTIEAYQLISQKVNYPLHVGITEAGIFQVGIIKSSVGIGAILNSGIGDTIRVSLSDEPVKEIEVAQEILRSLGLYEQGVEVISCPTCGRCQIDVTSIAQEIFDQTREIKQPLKVAVMGCEVNGPGEAAMADLALIGGFGEAVIMQKNKVIKKVSEKEMVSEFLKQIKSTPKGTLRD